MENTKELISLIIPVYNVENYVEKCLESACNQTYGNYEIILINDGSTDDSGRYVRNGQLNFLTLGIMSKKTKVWEKLEIEGSNMH